MLPLDAVDKQLAYRKAWNSHRLETKLHNNMVSSCSFKLAHSFNVIATFPAPLNTAICNEKNVVHILAVRMEGSKWCYAAAPFCGLMILHRFHLTEASIQFATEVSSHVSAHSD